MVQWPLKFTYQDTSALTKPGTVCWELSTVSLIHLYKEVGLGSVCSCFHRSACIRRRGKRKLNPRSSSISANLSFVLSLSEMGGKMQLKFYIFYEDKNGITISRGGKKKKRLINFQWFRPSESITITFFFNYACERLKNSVEYRIKFGIKKLHLHKM